MWNYISNISTEVSKWCVGGVGVDENEVVNDTNTNTDRGDAGYDTVESQHFDLTKKRGRRYKGCEEYDGPGWSPKFWPTIIHVGSVVGSGTHVKQGTMTKPLSIDDISIDDISIDDSSDIDDSSHIDDISHIDEISDISDIEDIDDSSHIDDIDDISRGRFVDNWILNTSRGNSQGTKSTDIFSNSGFSESSRSFYEGSISIDKLMMEHNQKNQPHAAFEVAR